MNDPCIRLLRIFATGSMAALLAACGGGGADASGAPAATPVATASIAAKPVAEVEPVETDTPAATADIVNTPLAALAAYGMAAAAVRPAGRGSNHLAVAGPPAELSH